MRWPWYDWFLLVLLICAALGTIGVAIWFAVHPVGAIPQNNGILSGVTTITFSGDQVFTSSPEYIPLLDPTSDPSSGAVTEHFWNATFYYEELDANDKPTGNKYQSDVWSRFI